MVNTLNFLKNYWNVLLAFFMASLVGIHALVVGLWVLWSPKVIPLVMEELHITQILDTLDRIEGNDRIIKEFDEGYVREPVYVGGNITLIQHFARTPKGEDCLLNEFSVLFVDDNGNLWAGETRRAAVQLNSQQTRREITTRVPEGVEPGSTTISLQMIYECPTATEGITQKILETTRPVRFFLNPMPPLEVLPTTTLLPPPRKDTNND